MAIKRNCRSAKKMT